MNFLKLNPLLETETREVFSKLLSGFAHHGFSYYTITQFVHRTVVYTMCQTHDDEWILTSHRRGDTEFDVYNIDVPAYFGITDKHPIPEPLALVNLWDEFIEMLVKDND